MIGDTPILLASLPVRSSQLPIGEISRMSSSNRLSDYVGDWVAGTVGGSYFESCSSSLASFGYVYYGLRFDRVCWYSCCPAL